MTNEVLSQAAECEWLITLAATRLFGRRQGVWTAIAGIAVHTLLVGAGASVVYAAIMGSLALTAQQILDRSAEPSRAPT